MAARSDYLIAAFSLVCQIGATVLLFKHGELGKGFSESGQWSAIAGVTFLYALLLRFLLNVRSRSLGGNRVPSIFDLISLYFDAAAMALIVCGIKGYTIHKLWLSALVPASIFTLVDLIRFSGLFKKVGIILIPLFDGVRLTEGYVFWRIVLGLLMLGIAPFLMEFRERAWVKARNEAKTKEE